MTISYYLRPIALAESPQSEEGAAVRLADVHAHGAWIHAVP